VKGSAIRATCPQKKRCRPIFFFSLNRYLQPLPTRCIQTRACVFVSSNRNAVAWRVVGEAIRSVSHLVLAPDELMLWLPNFRTERSGPDHSWPTPSGSVFLVNRSITTRARFGKRRAFTNSAPIPPPAGPENFQCRAAFIQSHRAVVPRTRGGVRGPTRW